MWDFGVIIRLRPLEGDIYKTGDHYTTYRVLECRMPLRRGLSPKDTNDGNGRLGLYCFWLIDLIDGTWLGNRLGTEHEVHDILRHLPFLCYLLESMHLHDFFICLSR